MATLFNFEGDDREKILTLKSDNLKTVGGRKIKFGDNVFQGFPD